MRNEVKINKHTGEVYLFSQASREQRAVMIKGIEGIVSFPIKVEEVKGNKDAITVNALYYQDSLMREDVRLLTFDERDDAIAARKELERAYRKHTGSSMMLGLGIPVIMIVCAFFAGRYLQSNDSIALSGVNYSQQGAASIPADSAMNNQKSDADTLEKLTKQYEQQLGKKSLVPQENKVSAENNKNNALLSSKEGDTLNDNKDSQEMMKMLSGQDNAQEQPKSQSEALLGMLNGESKK